jgi:hypothetical protein
MPSPPARLVLPLALAIALPLGAGAQQATTPPPGPPLAPFTAMRVAIVPVQLWRADTVGWSRTLTWATTRVSLDSAVQAVLEERGLGRKWAYPGDVVRAARRNPMYASDPYSLGVGRWRNTPPEAGEQLPGLLADNLRSVTALGDARHALIPVELRAEGDAVVLRLVLVDTRTRSVIWAGDLLSPAGANAGARMIEELATRIANLIVEP